MDFPVFAARIVAKYNFGAFLVMTVKTRDDMQLITEISLSLALFTIKWLDLDPHFIFSIHIDYGRYDIVGYPRGPVS